MYAYKISVVSRRVPCLTQHTAHQQSVLLQYASGRLYCTEGDLSVTSLSMVRAAFPYYFI
jgi:hypothetical protein